MPVPFYMVLTHLVATFFLLQVVPTMSEVSFKSFESATNMFLHVAREDDGDSLLLLFRCFTLSKLASCYVICNEYFSKVLDPRVIIETLL